MATKKTNPQPTEQPNLSDNSENKQKSVEQVCAKKLAQQLKSYNRLFTLEYCEKIVTDAFKSIGLYDKRFNLKSLGEPQAVEVTQVPLNRNINVSILFKNNKVIKFSLIHYRKADIAEGKKPTSTAGLRFKDAYNVSFAKSIDANVIALSSRIAANAIQEIE